MRFRLVYDGPLASSQGTHKAQTQWEIRKNLHPQLAELWTFKPALLGHTEAHGAFHQTEGGFWVVATTEGEGTPEERNRQRLLTPIERFGHRYLPLVRSSLFLTCTLDILFLRTDNPTGIVSPSGDLDNRIKVLFDALRPPLDQNERGPNGEIPDPCHVLTEDDSLITSFAVRSDRLLHRPGATKDSVVLVMDVTVTPTQIKTELNSGFGWD